MQPDQLGRSGQLTQHVKLTQKVTLISQGKVLLLCRNLSEATRPDCWDLPGGNMEWPEVATAATDLHRAEIVREVAEETGLKLASADFTPQKLIYFETYFDPTQQIFRIYCGWLIELPGDFAPESVRLSPEHSQLVWADAKMIPEMNFGGQAGQFIVRHIERSFGLLS